MTPRREVRFVGFFSSFPVDERERNVGLLEGILRLEKALGIFRRIDCGQVQGTSALRSFQESRLQTALRSLREGNADFLHLLPFSKDRDWAKSSEDSVTVYWNSCIPARGRRPLSPYEERFGYAGHVLVEYPLRRFAPDEEPGFQRELLGFARRALVDHGLHWAFVHLGLHPLDETGLGLASQDLGRDGPFLRTREGFPLTAFDTDLNLAAGYYKEYAKGAFWANCLNPRHVSALGGWDGLSAQVSFCEVSERLGNGGAFLQISRSPVDAPAPPLVEKYQRLRRILRPILLETPEEVSEVRRAVMGDWTPAHPSR